MEHAQADKLFEQVRQQFESRGLLGRVLRLELEGKPYSVRCDADCFSLYRINEKPHLPPGLPGWTVCRLTLGECFSLDGQEVCAPDEVPQDDGSQARLWVEAVLAALDEMDQQSI